MTHTPRLQVFDYLVDSSAEAGAISNQGTPDLKAVTAQKNIAQGQDGVGNSAAGGGVYSGGSLTMERGALIANNQAMLTSATSHGRGARSSAIF
jgi:hypothetical protein